MIVMVVVSPEQLKQLLMSRMKTTIQEMENQIHEIINQFLKQYYKEYEPAIYERTEQLLHSLVKSEIIQSSDGYACHVYFDLEKIDYSYKYINGKKYKNDTSKVGGTEGIVRLAMESHTHGGVIADKNTAIWTESMDVLNREKFNILKSCLIDNGIPIE